MHSQLYNSQHSILFHRVQRKIKVIECKKTFWVGLIYGSGLAYSHSLKLLRYGSVSFRLYRNAQYPSAEFEYSHDSDDVIQMTGNAIAIL